MKRSSMIQLVSVGSLFFALAFADSATCQQKIPAVFDKLTPSNIASVAVSTRDMPVAFLTTNTMGEVFSWTPIPEECRVSDSAIIRDITRELTHTGEYGDSNLCFSGVLPTLVFLDHEGNPVADAIVHWHGRHVIIATNVTMRVNGIFSWYPWLEGDQSRWPKFISGNNEPFCRKVWSLLEAYCPDSLKTTDLAGGNILHGNALESLRRVERPAPNEVTAAPPTSTTPE